MSYILTILFTLLSAYYDAQELKAGRYFKDHTPRALFRVLVLFIISVFTSTHILILLSVFYLLFDTLLNLIRGLKWNFIGDTAIHDIIWSRYLGGWIPQYITKITLVILTITFLN